MESRHSRSRDPGPADGSSAASPLRGIGRSAELTPGLLAVAVFIAWAAAEGGFPETAWYPGALFLLGLLAISSWVFRERLGRLPPVVLIALGLLAGFVVWSLLSTLWAESAALAWEGANRSLLYLLVFALFALLPWTSRSAAIVAGVASVGLAGVATAVLVDLAGSAQLSFIGARLADPTGYPNAVAALFVGGFWPAVFLASRRELPWAARGLLLAIAGLLLQVALISQSRGALIVFPIALLIYLLVVPSRLRATATVLLVLAATALAAPAILDVFAAAESDRDLLGAVDGARDAILVSFVALAALGAGLAALDRRVQASARSVRVANRVAALAAGAVTLIAVVVALVAVGNPADWADERWQDFKGDYDSEGFGESRFSGDLGSNRYDYWRVGIGSQFAQRPLVGDGADNFATPYLLERESDDEPLYPHSLPVRVLAGTGLVGAGLLGGFFIVALLAALRRRPRSMLARGLIGMAVGAFSYWALHSGGDWLWSFPAITAPIFAWLGMAAVVGNEADRADPPAPRSVGGGAPSPPRGLALGAIGAVLAVLAAVSFLLPWGAARDLEVAASSWGSDPEAAFERLDRARDLNFLSERPDLSAGTIALSLEEPERARQAFERALERQPASWFALLELGTLDLQDGRSRRGIARLEQAAALNPGDPLIQSALERAGDGDPLSSDEIEADLLGRVCARVGAATGTEFCD